MKVAERKLTNASALTALRLVQSARSFVAILAETDRIREDCLAPPYRTVALPVFQATRALQNLTVELDEAEQQRVLEYLALSNWAAKAARLAVTSDKKAFVLRSFLYRPAAVLTTQAETILSAFEGDRADYDQIFTKLDEWFDSRLRLAAHPRGLFHNTA